MISFAVQRSFCAVMPLPKHLVGHHGVLDVLSNINCDESNDETNYDDSDNDEDFVVTQAQMVCEILA